MPGGRGGRAPPRAARTPGGPTPRAAGIARRPRRTSCADAGRATRRRNPSSRGSHRRSRPTCVSTTPARSSAATCRQTRGVRRGASANRSPRRRRRTRRARAAVRARLPRGIRLPPVAERAAHWSGTACSASSRRSSTRAGSSRPTKVRCAQPATRDGSRERHRLVRAPRRRRVRQHARDAARAARSAATGTLQRHAQRRHDRHPARRRGANGFARCPAWATRSGDAVRFTRSQVGLLDALLAAMPAAAVDEKFEHARRELHSFETLQPADPPPSFNGELRPYQRDGLAWLHFLQRFGFGGCLADDMGLGKTVQALALLEERRLGESSGPSLVVVPRSLLFNWRQEATRFTPEHARARYTRGASARATPRRSRTTTSCSPPTARCAATRRCSRRSEFDYVILDEAQAIKNATTETAKAARLLRAKHRLALSGTPIENRLAELWSLFEFLNPGMLGARARVQDVRRRRRAANPARSLIARAVRPFILRRTKEQVAPELPEKLEQTIYVRARAERSGSATTSCAITTARRCSAAIDRGRNREVEDPDPRGAAAPAAGGVSLRRCSTRARGERVEQQVRRADAAARGDRGRGAQGARVLAVHVAAGAAQAAARRARSVVYEYLDGQTRDREERVSSVSRRTRRAGCSSSASRPAGSGSTSRRRTTCSCSIRGGTRRSRRRRSTARTASARRGACSRTRLIARDTVEEKVLELQQTKRDLADAIIGGDSSLIRANQARGSRGTSWIAN